MVLGRTMKVVKSQIVNEGVTSIDLALLMAREESYVC